MAYSIDFRPSARRAFFKLSPGIQARLRPHIDALEANPRPPGCKKLQDSDNVWRIRIGEHRILYQIFDRELLILVLAVGHRREVYRN
jgi:mRNA interferase RelE/StbE